MKKQPRKQFVINVDENDPEFRKHILRRLEFAKEHPEKSVSVDDFFQKRKAESSDYEKDPRFIAFIKNRVKLADNPKNRTPVETVVNELRIKYGVS
jgi:hypothetical protein